MLSLPTSDPPPAAGPQVTNAHRRPPVLLLSRSHSVAFVLALSTRKLAPSTCRLEVGFAVPMPTLPEGSMTILSAPAVLSKIESLPDRLPPPAPDPQLMRAQSRDESRLLL